MKKSLLTSVYMFLCLLCCCSFVSSSVRAQSQPQQKAPAAPKQLEALRITEPPKVDGVLDEAIWQQAQVATNFIQNRPNPGPPEVHPTEVRILYDDEAIYVGAVMHDVSQDSIFRQLGQRDDLGNTDFFGVFLDTYNDQLNGFGFFTTPAGVQLDARYSSNGEDWSWNAVWESNATIQGTNWVAEFRIPYSAIRFSSKPEQLWGLNFMRNRQSTKQGYFWNHVDPAKDGFANQWGKLKGLKNIEAPLRLSFTPYISAYAESIPQISESSDNVNYRSDYNFGGGMDVKYGINDAFTLDMTLIPDFSQVQSDNQVLNLSPFEVQYNENRPFFMEGTELFNKGDFLYSRRIGGRPVNMLTGDDEEKLGIRIIDNPIETKMLNGTKVSGRTDSGLGVGVFNAVVGRQYATVEDTLGNRFKMQTQPLTNYNITVFDQSLKNNSYITLLNNNVMRQGSTYDANLTAMLFRLVDKTNTYAIEGKAALSQKYVADSADLGHTYRIGLSKMSGNFQVYASHTLISDTYDPNDLGINFVDNSMEENLQFNYNFYQPFWKFLNMYTSLGAVYARRYKPDTFQNFVVYGQVNATTKNFLSLGLNFNLEPVTTYDFFEPRVDGWYYTFPTNYSAGGYISSDYRKKFALDLRGSYRWFDENSRSNYSYTIAPRYRVNDKLMFVYNFTRDLRLDDMGFANQFKFDENGDKKEEQLVIFGLRDVNATSSSLTSSYSFNNRMSLSLRARHYWSKAEYNQYYRLATDGHLSPDSYPNGYNGKYKDKNHNINFNVFNIDMVYSWWFAPGSEISIVWKNAIHESKDVVVPRYLDNFSNTISSPQNNSISVKLLYYIDYLTLKKRFTKA
ncbi:DUF5916 domain-containing protein [Pontibacter ruber]|uniref:DUF5916 domain-containing protein n=1 Tax=Pontibacter ruber TaxID=1343895 RepID=A0ABW5CWX9_9BACT|nr:DUF5916 domain-containing protein [Pontibacter ruber]